MTRHERRKAVRARKNAKAANLNARAMLLLKEETRKRNLARPMPKRTPRGMGNSSLWDGTRYLKGFGTGAFKEKPLGERHLRELRSQGR
jgi:hypothetical protein